MLAWLLAGIASVSIAAARTPPAGGSAPPADAQKEAPSPPKSPDAPKGADAPGAPGASKPPTKPESPRSPSSPEGPKAPPAPARPAATPRSIHSITLKDFDGKDVPLSKFAGKPMVIEVWATWCGPCVKQRALLNTLAPEFKDKVVFIGASVDQLGPKKVKEHLAARPVAKEFVDCMSTPELGAAVAVRDRSNTIPKILYVDSKGLIVDVGSSAQDEKWMRAMIKKLR